MGLDADRGPTTAENIDDRIDAWHDSPKAETRELHEYLGWTWEEYKAWVGHNVFPATREEL